MFLSPALSKVAMSFASHASTHRNPWLLGRFHRHFRASKGRIWPHLLQPSLRNYKFVRLLKQLEFVRRACLAGFRQGSLSKTKAATCNSSTGPLLHSRFFPTTFVSTDYGWKLHPAASRFLR